METPRPPIAPAQQVPQTSGMAIASLVTGLLCLAPLAIIFGHMAMSRIKKSAGQLTGHGLALAGTILGYVGLVVLMILPVALSIMFVGARAWKNGSDRAACILNTRNVQQSVRAHHSMNALNYGDPIDWNEIFGPSKFLIQPTCPSGGTYTFSKVHPPIGKLACTCSHADHIPPNHSDW